MMSKLGKDVKKDAEGKDQEQPSFNSIFMMADSGAGDLQLRLDSLLVCVV